MRVFFSCRIICQCFNKHGINFCQDMIQIVEHLIVPKADDANSSSFKMSCSCIVQFQLFSVCVLTTVNLNRKVRLTAIEVEDVTVDNVLTAEFLTGKLTRSQSGSQQSLCWGLIVPESTRFGSQLSVWHEEILS